MQQGESGNDLPGAVSVSTRANYRELFSDRSFFRFFVGQVASSFGDWVGLLAILAVVKRIYDNEFAVAAVLLARLGPALFFGPIAGVVADRWDRKKVMVSCDLARAALILVLPFIDSIGSRVPLLSPVVLLFVISGLLEMLTLMWQPAKDSCVPEMVRDSSRYTHAYSLLLLAAYATFPLSGATFGLLTNLSKAIGKAFSLEQFSTNRELLALFFDSFTFLVSAGLTMTLAIAPRARTKRRLDLKVIWAELTEGLRFIRNHKMIYSWVLGIAGTFAGIGVFLSLALFFVSDVLGGGPGGFGLLVTAVGTGLGAGFILAGPASRVVPKDILFSLVVVGMGVALIGFGSTSTLATGLLFGSICGLFGGFAYPTGYALVQERLAPELRGRASAAVNSVIRLAVLGASTLSPALVRLIDLALPSRVSLMPGQFLDLRGIRVVMWLGGLTILGAGLYTTKAVRARRSQPAPTQGLFVVFEGGEGAGKSTQIEKLKVFFGARGQSVLVTREPGGTEIGERIRDILLDPGSVSMSAKAEALLYSADRAQHVAEAIEPALRAGSVVVSDRYVHSSIAYQGLARGLGLEEITNLNTWATGGLMPDVVFLFDFDAAEGLARAAGDDRIEQEGLEFHEKVREAYRILVGRHSDRFVVIDASKTPEEIAAIVQQKVEPLLERNRQIAAAPQPQAKKVAT
ncbi:MAG: dTMP kinase [Actinomycetota bacterium]